MMRASEREGYERERSRTLKLRIALLSSSRVSTFNKKVSGGAAAKKGKASRSHQPQLLAESFCRAPKRLSFAEDVNKTFDTHTPLGTILFASMPVASLDLECFAEDVLVF